VKRWVFILSATSCLPFLHDTFDLVLPPSFLANLLLLLLPPPKLLPLFSLGYQCIDFGVFVWK
jgi:hypothetical protein